MARTDRRQTTRACRPGSPGWRFVAFRTPVRGYRYAPRPPGAGHPRIDQPVGLLREVDHPLDRWAVGVWVRAGDGTPWRVGYLERAVAARIGPHIDAGDRVAAYVAGWTPEPDARWWRPVIRIEPASEPATRRRRPER